MLPPPITASSRAERIEYVQQQWECMDNCKLCGKCSVLRGREPEAIYADYIEGTKSYAECTIAARE